MQLNIYTTHPSETRTISQILKFYTGRLDYQLASLEIRLKNFTNTLGHNEYNLWLRVKLPDGNRIELQEIQSDAVYASHRALDRLVRHLNRLHGTSATMRALSSRAS